jgi:hypothetical protein
MTTEQKKHTWDPVSFLEVWTDRNVAHQPPNVRVADQLAKKFMADAEALGFVLAQFMFNEASLARYIAQAMASPRD